MTVQKLPLNKRLGLLGCFRTKFSLFSVTEGLKVSQDESRSRLHLYIDFESRPQTIRLKFEFEVLQGLACISMVQHEALSLLMKSLLCVL